MPKSEFIRSLILGDITQNMDNKIKSILKSFKYPFVIFALLTIPGINSFIFFNQHACFTPIVGLLSVYCLPLCTPFIVYKLTRIIFAYHSRKKKPSVFGFDYNEEFHGIVKYCTSSFIVYILLSYPLSYLMGTGLNYSGTWNLHWNQYVLQKMMTFPIGFMLPPFKPYNRATLEFMLKILEASFKGK